MTATDSGFPVARGAASGICAWLGGYLLVYLLTAEAVRTSTLARLIASVTGGDEWRVVGWLFYGAHLSPSTVPELFGGETVNLVSAMNDVSALLVAVPPALLFLAGVAVRIGEPRLPTTAAAIHGLAVVLGYLPAALVGLILLTVDASGLSAGPTPVSAIGLVGVVYPAAFGPLGALVGNRLP